MKHYSEEEMSDNPATQDVTKRLNDNMHALLQLHWYAKWLAHENPLMSEMSNDFARVVGMAARWINYHEVQLLVPVEIERIDGLGGGSDVEIHD